jgi:DNA-binding CsgD family transcriptional regulator
MRGASAASVDRIHQLWDRLADAEASQIDEVLLHTLSELAGLVDATNAYWVGSVRMSHHHGVDPIKAWRPRAVRYLHPSEPDTRFYMHARRALDAGQVDESVAGNLAQAGTFRANLLRDLVSKDWYKTPFYDVGYRARSVIDALFVITPVNRDAESFFGFHRQEGQPRFRDRDRDLLVYALRGLKWFHRHLMLSHGLALARSPLSAAERRVLRLLLTNLSEKEIAARLELTPGTTHVYVTEILRKFNVSGRAGLTAVWLGQSPPPSN